MRSVPNFVTVIYPGDVQFSLPVPSGVVTTEEILDWTWRMTNAVDEGDPILQWRVRSSMVGDIFLVNGVHYNVIETLGFKEVDKETAEKWQKIQDLDRCFGFDWCKEKGLI